MIPDFEKWIDGEMDRQTDSRTESIIANGLHSKLCWRAVKTVHVKWCCARTVSL